MDVKQVHSEFLKQELQWLKTIINIRIELHFNQSSNHPVIESIAPPVIDELECIYTQIIQQYHFGWEERLVLILAQAAHFAPQIMDVFLVINTLTNRPYTEFGGRIGKAHRGFIPSIETALFLLAGDDLSRRLDVQTLFEKDHPFQRFNILEMDAPNGEEPEWSCLLQISEAYKNHLSYNRSYAPTYSARFPAAKIKTPLHWEDLVLESSIKDELKKIHNWIQHQETILHDWGFSRHLKPGYQALFFGPPGTGKHLSAAVLGKITGHDVYRIDLSQIVSKYIGETEKKLNHIFENAQQNNWILFFDEADALFSHRTAVQNSNDHFANQETSFLLQRIEHYPGVIVLASNQKMNIDQAFSRRFQSIIHFPMPDARQRLQLWKNIFSTHPILEDTVDLNKIASKYELSGGDITKVLRRTSLVAIGRSNNMVNQKDIEIAIKKELNKSGKMT